MILVTGATGNVGAAVIRALPPDAPVRIGDIDVERAREMHGDAHEIVRFDFTDPVTYGATFENVERLFLIRPPALANVERDIAPALAAAEQAGVQHVVFLSLIGVEHNRIVPHHAIEQHLIQSGMTWTFLRASFFMQNMNTTHRAEIRDRDEIFVPAGRGKTSFIDVRDIAAVAACALTESGHTNQAYPLTGGSALDYYEVAAIFTDVLGRTITYRNPSVIWFVWRKLTEGVRLPFVLIMTALYQTARFGKADTVTPDTARLLGRVPIPLRQYVEDYRACWE